MSASFDSKTIRFKGVYCDQYQTVYDAFGTKPTSAYALAQNTMVKALVDGGYWTSRMDLFYVLANNDETNAKLNWVNPIGSYNLTDPGSTNPSFVAYDGYTGDGSSDYLSTGFNPRNNKINTDLNNVTIGVWLLLNKNETTVPFGTSDGTTTIAIYPRSSGDILATLNGGVINGGPVTGATSVGLSMATRRGSTDLEIYKDGSSEGTDTDLGTFIPNATLFLLSGASSGTPAAFTTNTVSIAFIMNAISTADASAIYTILNTYIAAIA